MSNFDRLYLRTSFIYILRFTVDTPRRCEQSNINSQVGVSYVSSFSNDVASKLKFVLLSKLLFFTTGKVAELKE